MDFKEQLKKWQDRVNERLTHYMDDLPVTAVKLQDAMRYGVLLGGKRMRPFLVYETARLVGGDLNIADAPAAAIECIHAYSLIHDDLPAMDDDKLRRGRPTVHVAFGEAQAVLAGDALQSLAFEILSSAVFPDNLKQNQLKMLNILAHGAGVSGMCGGQELDLEAENKSITQPELEKLHRHKTGALIESAAVLGLLTMPNVDADTKNGIAKFARVSGLAFQVWDDVLDIIADTKILGKPQGSDTEENKSTYPKLLGLEGAKKYATQLADEAVAALDSVKGNTDVLKAFAHYTVERDH